MRIDGRWLIASSLVLVLAACAKKEQPAAEQAAVPAVAEKAAPEAPAAAALDPCTLLTADEVKEATGKEAQGPTPNPRNARVCDFKLGEGGLVNVTYDIGETGLTPERFAEEMKSRNIPLTPQAGVGDAAFFADQGYGMVQINAFKGTNRYVVVTLLVPGSAPDKTKDVAIKLAKNALARF